MARLAWVIAMCSGLVVPDAFAQVGTPDGFAHPAHHSAPGVAKGAPEQLAPSHTVTPAATERAPAFVLVPGEAKPASVAEENLVDAPDVHPAAEPGVVSSWLPNHQWIYLPRTLLWQPPLANHYEPRCSLKFLSLDSRDVSPVADSGGVTDFNLGATFGIFRVAPAGRPDDGFQLDIFGLASSRFIALQDATATDFRGGIPLTFARGPWSFKLSYEHTSTHLGDEFLVRNQSALRKGTREDLVFGVAYRPHESIRLYGVFAYAVHISSLDPDPDPERFYFGAEWSRPLPTGWRGQPFAAIDVDLRGDQNYAPNLTVQAGWQWIPEAMRPGMRLLLEYYDGRAPFGQFMDRRESWFAFGLAFDF